MGSPLSSLIYLMFFLSGATALIYEIVWVRSLGLIFGGSHQAVTTVLSIFMAGLALGSYMLGKVSKKVKNPFKLYGELEIGIALFALIFIMLMKAYPSIYIFLAQGKEDFPLYLSLVRVAFAVTALIIPTTLMGATLPVLSSFVSRNIPKELGSHLSFLYGYNTLGAVAGTIAAGFLLLPLYSVSTTLHIAILVNFSIGLMSIFLQSTSVALKKWNTMDRGVEEVESDRRFPLISKNDVENTYPLRLVLWGIGVSGFCALGYEVLWTRILSMVVGASVYGFTVMLAAFLTGIALGGTAYGFFRKWVGLKKRNSIGPYLPTIVSFGIVHVMIGVTAILVTYFLRDLPANSIRLQEFFFSKKLSLFGARQWANFALAFSYMIVPAFFMGVAFPLAGEIHIAYKRTVGHAVGEVLAFNTIGALLGSATSGFVLIYLFGIERSLQYLSLINVAFGLLVLFSIWNIRFLTWGLLALTLIVIVFSTLTPTAWRIWNRNYFAIYRSNQPEAFRTPEMVREAIENTDVLYYHEGVEASVSSIKVKGGDQAFLINGRIEASTRMGDLQCQFTLGHLPMLLHRNPKKILVIGLGSGITLGATSVYPGVEKLTLVELEPKVVGVARTFENYNHRVLDHPKLKMVFNDGRNFLMTTREKFDVITADPIHPWFRGAGYLYTAEYFKIAAEHLLPGGIMCQWLPIYELDTEDLKSVVKTFSEHFPHTMIWLTRNDAEMIGSSSPILVDEMELERRMAEPKISNSLKSVMMGSASDLLSYFVMGTEGAKAFSQRGTMNTDENLYLEFSAPLSITRSVMGGNVNALARHRESILPYLAPPGDEKARGEQKRKWMVYHEAAQVAGRAQALFLGGRFDTPEFFQLMETLEKRYPFYAPGGLLRKEYAAQTALEPKLLKKVALTLLTEQGAVRVVEISSVVARINNERVSVIFVDNEARAIYGQMTVDGVQKERFIDRFVDDVMMSVWDGYQKEVNIARLQGKKLPPAEPTIRKIKDMITLKVDASAPK